jgi:hypothetical protein
MIRYSHLNWEAHMHPNKAASMTALKLEETDFSDSDLTEDEKKEYHTNLSVDVHSGFSFFVDSANPKMTGYVVFHDWKETLSCTCRDYVYRKSFCKHQRRVTLILLRRKVRLFTQALAKLAQAILEAPVQREEVILSNPEKVDKTTSLNRPSGGGGFYMFK